MTSPSILSEAIEKIVDEWWTERQAPVLLSKLGSLLSPELLSWVRTERIALKQFVQQEMSDRVRVLRMPRHGGGVAPLERTRELSERDLEALFESQRRAEIENRLPRYNRFVWDAFRTPLTVGHRRFVQFRDDGGVEVKEIGVDSPPPAESGWIEVEQEHLGHISGFAPPSPREMDAAIKGWAEGRVESRKLLQAYRSEPPSVAGRSGKQVRLRSEGLDSILAGLRGFTVDELSRIQIPADVLLSLLERNNLYK